MFLGVWKIGKHGRHFSWGRIESFCSHQKNVYPVLPVEGMGGAKIEGVAQAIALLLAYRMAYKTKKRLEGRLFI